MSLFLQQQGILDTASEAGFDPTAWFSGPVDGDYWDPTTAQAYTDAGKTTPVSTTGDDVTVIEGLMGYLDSEVAAAATAPSWTSTSGGFLTLDGITDALRMDLGGTGLTALSQPYTIGVIANQVTWTNLATLIGRTGTRWIYQSGSTPTIRSQINASDDNTPTIGAWFSIVIVANGAAGKVYFNSETPVTIDTSTTTADDLHLGSRIGTTSPGNFSVGPHFAIDKALSDAEVAEFVSAGEDRFGAF